MSFSVNPSMVTSGLTFAIDAGSQQSYKGPAIQNLTTGINTQSLGSSAFYNFSAGSEQVYIPNVGPQMCTYVDMYNDYNGGSGSCCPSPYNYGNGIAVSGSTLYTYAILYKSVNRYTHPNWMYHYEYNGSGTYLTEYGVHMAGGYSGTETHLGDDWYWSRAKFTTQATAATINTGSWMYQYATYNRFYVAKILIAAGDWTNLHPRYWPASGITRSSAQAVVDLTGKNTVTANSITSSDIFTFNGSNGNIVVSNAANLQNQNTTIDCWIKNNGTLSGDIIQFGVGSGSYAQYYLRAVSGNTYFDFFPTGASNYGEVYVANSTYFPSGTWKHVTVTGNSTGAVTMYINGVSVGSPTLNATTSVSSWTPASLTIGGYSWDGFTTASIGSVKIYNRALSAAEIQQNFQAQRGRYGV